MSSLKTVTPRKHSRIVKLNKCLNSKISNFLKNKFFFDFMIFMRFISWYKYAKIYYND